MAELGEENNRLSIKVNVDTSEAVNSIKKLQRVARETVKDLRVLDALKPSGDYPLINEIESFTTKELTDELAKREGVREFVVYPGELVNVHRIDAGWGIGVTGPARILINHD